MKIKFSILHSLFLILFLSGCSSTENSNDLVRRARLTGQENIQLKNQIADQQKLIEENSKQIAELQSKLEKAGQEIAAANELSKEMENRLNASLLDYQHQLEQCLKAVTAAPVPCPEVEEQYGVLLSNLSKILADCQQKLEKYEQQSEGVE